MKLGRENPRAAFVEAATELLKHGVDADDRAVAAGVLGTLGASAHIPLLLEVLEHDDSRRVQHKVSQAISRIGGEKAEAGLQDLMYAEDQYTRFLAAEALADIIARGSL